MDIQNLSPKAKKKLAFQFILLFGLVSALGDITYEGARSVQGPYLAVLGASAGVVGLVSGVGEFLGYVLRLVSGYLVDKTGKNWGIAILGYGMLISVPLLALAGHWQLAALFVFLERTGKALRSPAKDAMLSHATKQVGTGMGFGIHEFIDQIGGVIGPLMFTAVLAVTNSYKFGFNLMWIPALLTVVVLFIARAKVPQPVLFEETEDSVQNDDSSRSIKLPRVFWVYSLFIFFCVLGFAHFQVISYHLIYRQVVSQDFIPALYAIAMAVDAIVALIVGKLYDKVGFRFLIIMPIFTLPIVFLSFSLSFVSVIIGVVLWGTVMAMHETIMRAGIADLIPKESRGRAYGIFNTLYGLSWLIGSTLMGYFYESSIAWIFVLAVISEFIAAVVFLRFGRDLQSTVKR